ncbi:MAG: serine hydrolase domain-containing protein [Clostridiaceae bacterium]|nr:serine hydrolase domain-containing protein [Clostridiaceae bacterium]
MNFEPMKAFMDRLTAWRIPGNTVSICLNNKEVFNYQSGYSDYEKKIPMGRDCLFNIYSCSKIVTVTAALQLYERGHFLLDDPLYNYIPEYREMDIKGEDGKEIKAKNPMTLRHLFTMTSGLTYNTHTAAFDKARSLTDGKMNTLTVAKCIASDPLSFEPGTRWQYSLSHDVLAAVVEVISGKKFRDYVQEHIFDPLAMHESYYHNENVRDRMAPQYIYENTNEIDMVKLQSSADNKQSGRIVRRDKSDFDLGSEFDGGGAGITTSAADYSKFASALANYGMGANKERILAGSTVELMRCNQLSEKVKKDFTWSQLKGYGYGLGVRTLMDKTASGSTGNLKEFGWGGAAGATVLIDADIGLSLFYAHHMLNPQEDYYQPRLRNVLYTCING